jgi:hypothetical protein
MMGLFTLSYYKKNTVSSINICVHMYGNDKIKVSIKIYTIYNNREN